MIFVETHPGKILNIITIANRNLFTLQSKRVSKAPPRDQLVWYQLFTGNYRQGNFAKRGGILFIYLYTRMNEAIKSTFLKNNNCKLLYCNYIQHFAWMQFGRQIIRLNGLSRFKCLIRKNVPLDKKKNIYKYFS